MSFRDQGSRSRKICQRHWTLWAGRKQFRIAVTWNVRRLTNEWSRRLNRPVSSGGVGAWLIRRVNLTEVLQPSKGAPVTSDARSTSVKVAPQGGLGTAGASRAM